MLTTAQADHFCTFGFIVLRGFLADRTAALRAEVGAAIRDAYAAPYDERVIDGISGHYLPMAARLTPVSASLVCDDPRFIDAAEQLLGGPVIPECPEGVLYFAALLAVDPAGTAAGVPAVLMSRLPGRSPPKSRYTGIKARSLQPETGALLRRSLRSANAFSR